MKKLLLLTGIICVGLALSGQSRWAFGLEIEGGYGGRADFHEETITNPPFGSFSTISSLNRQPGWAAGVWAEYLLSHRIGLRMAVNYGHWGVYSERESISYDNSNTMTSYVRNRYYQQQGLLRIPLEGKLYLGPAGRRTRFFVTVGVQGGYLLSERNITNHYSGALGQSGAYEETFGGRVDLNDEWIAVKRWQTAISGGLGVTMDRATLSLQRNWNLSENYNYGFDACCGFGFCDCFVPSSSVNRLPRQIRQTSLRFSYRLF